jgi:hypothetical protein
MVHEDIVKRAIDQMHIEAIHTELAKMPAGKVEVLKEDYNVQGDLNYLAHHLWHEYQKDKGIK